MTAYSTDRKWTEQYTHQICEIIQRKGPSIIKPAPVRLDIKEATDLVVFHLGEGPCIAARLRRPGYDAKYPYDITIRSKRESGTETEYSKIMKGFADWMFYGHVNQEGTIHRWFLIDLDKFRGVIKDEAYMDRHCGDIVQVIPNNDNMTTFKSFNLQYFPPEVVLATNVIIPTPVDTFKAA